MQGFFCLLLACSLPARSAAQHRSETIQPTELQLLVGSSTVLRQSKVQDFLVLEESVARAEKIDAQTLRLEGLAPGKTLLLVWTAEGREAYAVYVLAKPTLPEAQLRTRPEAPHAVGWMQSGYSQASNNLTGLGQVLLQESFFLQQRIGQTELTASTQTVQTPNQSRDFFNLSAAMMSVRRPDLHLELLDYGLGLGGPSAIPYIAPIGLRGVHVILPRGDRRIEVFGGVTVPAYFLRLTRTRDVAGASFQWSPRRDWQFRWTGGFLNSPQELPSGAFSRSKSGFALFDLEHELKPGLTVAGAVGAGSGGALVRGGLRYTTLKTGLIVEGNSSSQDFALNQANLLLLGPKAFSAQGWRFLLPRWSVNGSLQVSRSDLKFPLLQSRQSETTNFTTHLQLRPQYTLDAQVSFVRDRSGTAAAQPFSTVRRTGFDIALSSRSEVRWVNVVRFISGRTHTDAQTARSSRDWSVEDRLVHFFGRSRSNWTVFGSYGQGTVGQPLLPIVPSPSALPPPLAEVFRANSQSASFSTALQLVGRRFNLGPSFGFQRSNSSASSPTQSVGLGGNFNVWLRSNLSLVANVSETFANGEPGQQSRRSNGFGISLQRYFSSTKAALLWGYHPTGRVTGVVFEDANLNGRRDVGEKGIAGVTVQLSTGATTSTDQFGRYEFRHIPAGRQEITLDAAQFGGAVRFTAPTHVPLLFHGEERYVVDFGFNNLSQLLLVLYNDYRLDGARYPDAPGVADVVVKLVSPAATLEGKSDSSGRIEFRDIVPGTYQVEIDENTVPPDYVLEQIARARQIEVSPAQIKSFALPVQALRAIRGTVFYDANRNGIHDPGESGIEGVRVAAGDQVVVSGAQGEFLFIGLPAADIEIKLDPDGPVPDEFRALLAPVHVKLGMEPGVKNGVALAVSDMRLVELLSPQFPKTH